ANSAHAKTAAESDTAVIAVCLRNRTTLDGIERHSDFILQRGFHLSVNGGDDLIRRLAGIWTFDCELLFDGRCPASPHHGNSLPQQYGLADVMSDIDNSHSILLPDPKQLFLHDALADRIKSCKWLVHQQHLWL